MTPSPVRSTDDHWRAARALLDGLPGGGLNIAHEAVDRHASGEVGERVAVRWRDAHDDVGDVTYRQLAERSNRFANALGTLGVAPGEVVCVLLGRVPELFTVVLGALKHRAVVCPLFSAYGPEPVAQRIQLADARVLVTTRSLLRRRVAPVRASLTSLRTVVVVDDDGSDPSVVGLDALLDAASPTYTIGPTDPETPALLHFTSGTTGTPKGVVHVHDAVVAHHVTARDVLGLQPGDRYWCTADPGWVTGMSYGIIAPLTNGATVVIDAAEFDAERWYTILEAERVQVWYTAPTALRMLRRAGTDAAHERDLRALRTVASVGEPLEPDVVRWGRDAFGVDVLDTWWQTETGAIAIANRPGVPVRPGSMGRVVPGFDAAILERDADGRVVLRDGQPVLAAPGVVGELALRRGWPSMFRGYLGMDERYRATFAGDWYCTGDLARVDDDGYFWFVGRGDDVITSAGHLVGPFEVECVLAEHPAVAEVAVVGTPDPVAGALVTAHVVLAPGVEPSDEVVRDVLAFARRRLGPALAPRSIELRPQLPRTRSGKLMRRVLRDD